MSFLKNMSKRNIIITDIVIVIVLIAVIAAFSGNDSDKQEVPVANTQEGTEEVEQSVDADNSQNESSVTEAPSSSAQPEPKNNYKTSLSWADLNHYMFSVENGASYNGDNVMAGTYRFYPEAVTLGDGSVPIVWDIYVSNNMYQNISNLQESEYVGTVGGTEKNEITLDLIPGNFVYVKYNETVSTPTGYLQIDKIE